MNYYVGQHVGFVDLIDHEPNPEPDPPIEEQHWAVCRAYSNRVHIVRPEIEKTRHGTFLPTYIRVWASDGKLSVRERALMPGYLFFFARFPKKWTDVKNVYGVFDVLANNGMISKVTEAEMHRLRLAQIRGSHDDIDLSGLDRKPRQARQSSRKPRASRRARAAA